MDSPVKVEAIGIEIVYIKEKGYIVLFGLPLNVPLDRPGGILYFMIKFQ